MADGILGEAILVANTPTNLYQVPVGKVATFTASFCNTGTTTALVTLRCPTTVNGLTTYFEYKATVVPGTPLERSGIPIQAGRYVIVESDTTNVCAVVVGFTEDAV